MEIVRNIKENETVSVVTVDDHPAFTMGRHSSMLTVFNGGNEILRNAHYGDDYLIRDSPDGAVIGRWFVAAYGWKRFWPPGATIPRVERILNRLRSRAQRANSALKVIAAEIIAETSIPRQEFVLGHTGEREFEIVVCGLNRFKNEIEYRVNISGDGRYSIGRSEGIARTSLGDKFARVADRSRDAWCEYGRFAGLFDDLVLRRLLADKRSDGIHRVIVNGCNYLFRLFRRYEHGIGFVTVVESLDDHGAALIMETKIV